MWAIVHFTADNTVDYVPSGWIRKNGITVLCAWPNNDMNLKKFRSNRLNPNKSDFTYYKCRVISKDIALLSEARIKAEKAKFTSDVSDVDNYKTKQKNINPLNKSVEAILQKRSSLLPDHSLEYVDENCIMVKNDDGFNLCESDESSENLSTIDDSDADKDYKPINKGENKDNTNIWLTEDMSEVNDESMVAEDTQNNKSGLSNSTVTHNYCDTPTLPQLQPLQSQKIEPVHSQSFIDFQKATLSYLAFLKIEISKIADNQQQILEHIKLSNNVNIFQGSAGDQRLEHEIDYFIHNWPISTKEGLTNMEEKMKLDVNFKKQVVWELARVGGKSLKSMIYKMMKKVFEDQVLISYTYYGLRNKENFSLLAINKAIFAVNKSSIKHSSDDEIITSIGKWLTCAKGRLEKKN
ncbi:uncharacterized protein LOC112597974 isoform X2 [Melanaphis sacchari]|uniref:uncharacterized protein LOC112597974 isoform X2 n=1 Tax=Melanaphis sacchari TaxID=742174 RepID=UPI000DC139F2|nr:uncharacterized protein LOC112597974 isoform X2 [Melanaphis sacchari]